MFYLIVAIAIFAAGVGTGWKADEAKHSIAEAARVKAQQAAQIADDKRTKAIGDRFAKGLASLKDNNAATNAKVLNELSQAIYTQCVLPDSGRVLLDTRADELNRAAGLGDALPADPAPAPKPAGKVDDGGSGAARQKLDAAIRGLRATAEKPSGSRGGSSGANK